MKRLCRLIFIFAIGPFFLWSQRIQPEDLKYMGAFRLPDGPDEIGWGYSGEGLTFYPDGDLAGPEDGFTGSLFGIGHDWNTYVSEISIPLPVISTNKNPSELNTAVTLQPFANIRPAYFDTVDLEQTRAGLAYLNAQGDQSTGKLYYCFAPHLGGWDAYPSHGWCELDLSSPQPAGPWRLGEYWNYVTADYIFEIPESWANSYTPGLRLATGRFRDGGQGSQGPTMIAYGPWNEGNPPEQGSAISCTPLLLYGNVEVNSDATMNNYHHSDEWAGGAWLTAGNRSAVVFVGTKGQGNCWYGLIDGTLWEEPDTTGIPEWLIDTRGWWSEQFVGQMIFYDPDDLAAVARGEMNAWEPQPYAIMDLDSYLYHVNSDQMKYHVKACAFDPTGKNLFVIEPLADGDKSIIHVWQVQSKETSIQQNPTPIEFQLNQNYPNPFNQSTVISYQLSVECRVKVHVFDVMGQEVMSIDESRKSAGQHRLVIDAKGLASGMYLIQLMVDGNRLTKKMMLIR